MTNRSVIKYKSKNMSPRSSEQFDDIRKQKKKLILDTALELFAENGFHATSISQIARKAGISKGLTYNYFESKKEILDELIASGYNEIYDNFDLNKDGTLTEEEFILFIKTEFRAGAEKPATLETVFLPSTATFCNGNFFKGIQTQRRAGF